jgi:hypothetical protein
MTHLGGDSHYMQITVFSTGLVAVPILGFIRNDETSTYQASNNSLISPQLQWYNVPRSTLQEVCKWSISTYELLYTRWVLP